MILEGVGLYDSACLENLKFTTAPAHAEYRNNS